MVERYFEGWEGIYPDDEGNLVKYEDYHILEAQLRQRTQERNAFARAIADAGDEMVNEAAYADAVALTERLGI